FGRVRLAVRPFMSCTKSASTTRERCAPLTECGWKRASARRTNGVYAAPASISRSQYQSLRAASYPTAWPATWKLFAGASGSSSRLRSVVFVSVASLNAARAGLKVVGPDLYIGSWPQSETYIFVVSSGGNAPVQMTTPSSSPSPEENHGRSRYARRPPPLRSLVNWVFSLSTLDDQPNVGTR